MRKKLLLFLFLCIIYAPGYSQQSIQFTQYVFNGLAVNPAYSGYKEEWTANLSYRLQWVGFENAPRTGTVSLDGITDPLKKNTGLGLLLTTDQLGPQNNSSVSVSYAYRLRLDEEDTRRLSFGIAAGAIQYSLDGSKFRASNPLDPSVASGNESKTVPDLRAGIYYSSPNLYAGVSMLNILEDNLNGVNSNLARQVKHLYLTAGILVPLSESMDFKPSVLLKEDFKGPTNMDLTAFLLIHKLIWAGASWRTGASIWRKANLQNNLGIKDAVAALIQVYVNKHLRIGYSFDFTLGSLAAYENGSHELSLSLGLPSKKARIISPRYF